MKIFNWVHRKFHPKDHERKSTEALGTNGQEMEKQALLKHDDVAFANMLDSLGDGILSIGTLGFDPLPNSFPNNITSPIHEAPPHHGDPQNNNYEEALMVEQVEIANKYSNSKECDDQELDQEITPLVFSAYGCDHLSKNNDIGSQSHNYEMVEMLNLGLPIKDDHVLKVDDKLMKEKKERITLADLFLAECDDKQEHCDNLKKKGTHEEIKDGHYVDGKKKFRKSFSKKLNLGSGSDPIKKVRGLMRKMIKKKIHPSIEEKIPKITDDSVSLLLREVATA